MEDLSGCVLLQRSVFALPEVELSPVRHFIVTMHAGGYTLGAFESDRLVGFVLSIPAFFRGERAFYSHMAAVDTDFQGLGIGSRLKWEQRQRALEAGVKFIKWTFQPVKARNAFFNLEKLGAVVTEYRQDFYGTDYAVSPAETPGLGIESDRLFAEWHLDSEEVESLSYANVSAKTARPRKTVGTTNDWEMLVARDPEAAKRLQRRIRSEFQTALSEGLVCAGFQRHADHPEFLFYDRRDVTGMVDAAEG